MHLGIRGKLTKGGKEMEGPLAGRRWIMTMEDRKRAGPMLWEATNDVWDSGGRRCVFSRALAAAGVATWADVTTG
jgi:hypothetical protein